MRSVVNIDGPIIGVAYQQLLAYAESVCTFALLVVRPTVALSANARGVLQALDVDFDSVVEGSSWPGTLLFAQTATIHVYRYTHKCATTLRSVANGLFDWRQPDLPEDLCLLRADRSPWLTTIAHEDDAYFTLENGEQLALEGAVAQLRGRLTSARDE